MYLINPFQNLANITERYKLFTKTLRVDAHNNIRTDGVIDTLLEYISTVQNILKHFEKEAEKKANLTQGEKDEKLFQNYVTEVDIGILKNLLYFYTNKKILYGFDAKLLVDILFDYKNANNNHTFETSVIYCTIRNLKKCYENENTKIKEMNYLFINHTMDYYLDYIRKMQSNTVYQNNKRKDIEACENSPKRICNRRSVIYRN